MSTLGMGTQAEGDASSMLLSPQDDLQPRRMRLRSNSHFEFSDWDNSNSLFQSSQPVLSSSQIDSLFENVASVPNVMGSLPAPVRTGIVLPPLVFQDSSLFSSAAPDAPVPSLLGTRSSLNKSLNKRSRHCCFLFTAWPKNKDVVVANIKKIVEDLTQMRRKSYSRGITLLDSPTYFFNKVGEGVYMVLTSASTYASKWKQVAEMISCQECKPVYRESSVLNGHHGFENIAKLFDLSSAEMDALHLDRVECPELPEARKRPKRKNTEEESEDEEDRPRGSADARKRPGKSPAKQQARYRMVRRKVMEPQEEVPAIELPPEVRRGVAERLEAGSLQGMSLQFVKSDNPIRDAPVFLRNLTEFIQSSDDMTARGAKYIDFFVKKEMVSLFHRFVGIQTHVITVLQQPPFSIPVESLTTSGIVLHHVAWQQLKSHNEGLYHTVHTQLDYLVILTDEFFRCLPHVFLDPVSTCFFIAVHILGKPRLDKSTLLYHTLKVITQVCRARGPCFRACVTLAIPQDYRRLFTAIRGMSDFLYAHVDPADLPDDVRGMLTPSSEEPIERLLEREAPLSIQEFVQETQISQRGLRITRFETLIHNMNKTYDLTKSRSKAEHLFGVMQESAGVFRNMTRHHRLYTVLCNAFSDEEELKTLYERIPACGTLV